MSRVDPGCAQHLLWTRGGSSEAVAVLAACFCALLCFKDVRVLSPLGMKKMLAVLLRCCCSQRPPSSAFQLGGGVPEEP
jgi:hypothetical protein